MENDSYISGITDQRRSHAPGGTKGIPGWIWRLTPILLLAGVCLVSCIRDRIPQGADLEVGARLPEFSVTMNDGSTVSMADLLGDISCIVFFHTGCPDCQKTLPLIQQLYDRYGNGPVRFLCISREEGAGEVETYWAENGYTLPYSAQEGREIYNLFATFAVPRIYISDRDGIIRSIWTDNPIPTSGELEAALLAAGEQP